MNIFQVKNLLPVVAGAMLFACSGAKTEVAQEAETSVESAVVVADGSYSLDSGNVVNWNATKVTGAHNGTVAVKSGVFTLAGGNITNAAFELDMNTIEALDIAGTDMEPKLEGHLKSPDFFNVAEFPVATFVLTSAEKVGEGDTTHVLKGNLTIKGITNEITFPAKVSSENGVVKASATTKIDRTLWDIRYNSGKFFPSIGDKMIHDEFEISFDLVGTPETTVGM